MARLNLVLMLAVAVLSLSVVTAQHRARKNFQGLEAAEQRARQLEEEYSQLQLEMSTWALPPRIEKIATERLRMHVPAPEAVIRTGAGR